MEQKSTKSCLYPLATIANLLAFSSGIAYAWSSPVLPKLNGSVDPDNNPIGYAITALEESWIVGFVSFGGIFGPMGAGLIADKIGRKKTLILLALPVLAAFLMLAFAKSVILFCCARLIMGLGVGSVYMILPIYLVEIAEDHNRGFLGCLMGVFITTGALFAYAVGPYLSVQNFCLFCTIPLLIFIPAFSIWNPESPQYLATIGDQERLKKSLMKLRSKTLSEIQKEMFVMGQMIQEVNETKGGIKELFASKYLRKGLIVTVGLIFFQQFAGINAVLGYMQSIFAATGSDIPSEISSVIIGIIQVCATILASSLADRLGRKILLLTSVTGSGLALVTLGTYFYLLNNKFDVNSISWLPIMSLVVFMLFFNFGLASVPWTVMAELFPPNVKSIALTLTTVMCFFGAFLITWCFPTLSQILGMAASFWVFAVICGFGACFIYWFLPETKGRSLQEIQSLLGKSS